MRLRRTFNYHALRKGRVRATWNKFNLYNLSKVERTIPNFIWRTFFQQKWTAKALTRAYHGEHIRESKWKRMFNRRLLSVVNMDPQYMAVNDGSEQATGRGSGRDRTRPEDQTPWRERGQTRKFKVKGRLLDRQVDKTEVDLGEDWNEKGGSANLQQYNHRTPYMNMTFAPLERRIDMAMFRAMFASSSRQARQFVIHGAVKINGHVMTHPSYLLNPGDMFQVDPDMVMYATGRKKYKHVEQNTKKPKRAARDAEEPEQEPEEEPEVEATAEGSEEATPEDSAKPADTDKEQVAKQLKALARMARRLLNTEKDGMSAKRKQHMRAFLKEAREVSSKLGRDDGQEAVTTDVVDTINSMLKELVLKDPKAADRAKASGAFSTEEVTEAATGAVADKPAQPSSSGPQFDLLKPVRFELSDEEAEGLKKKLQKYADNPVDNSKPYLTPWQPRRYMSPFAFIPRYLEVNQNICAAVYLRHPVARQGSAEVPSPFPPTVMQLAFNWYLRRR